MKLEREELIEQDTIGNFDTIESSIRYEDLGIAFDMVTKNLYSNPIGSFIRELVSNGVDANRVNNVNAPIEVSIYKEGSNWYFSVKDLGVGMDAEFFKSVYMKWFNSTKREDNLDIGGWGLGSKSPLAYAEYYTLKTISEGIEYNYIIARDSPVPIATLVSSFSTTEPSGTTVTVELDENDLYKLSKECEKQLSYFNNVYCVNEYIYYNNNFTIYESDLFRIRNNSFPFGDEMHICLGQVAYPIDWKILNMKPIMIPVALTFEIGELDVTISRESLDYKNENNNLKIKERIEKVTENLIQLYTDSITTDDFKEFCNLVANDDKKLIVGEVSIDMSKFKIRPLYSPLNLRVAYSNLSNLFDFFLQEKHIVGEKLESSYSLNIYSILGGVNINRIDGHASPWDIKYHKESVPDNAKYYSKRDYKHNLLKICKILNLSYTLSKKRRYPHMETHTMKEGASIIVYKLSKLIYDNYFTPLNPINGSAPSHWIDEQKEAERAFRESRKGIITYYRTNGRRSEISAGELFDTYDYVLYISRKEEFELKSLYLMLYNTLPNYYRKKLSFKILSPSVYNKYKNYKNAKGVKQLIPIENIWKIKNLANHFRRILLSEKLTEIKDNFQGFRYSKYYERKRTNLVKHHLTITSFEYSATNEAIELNLVKGFREELETYASTTPLHYEAELEEVYKVLPFIKILGQLDEEFINFTIVKFRLLRCNSTRYKFK